jgi:LuxR family transcriptional regulator, maltose regulon positive regulatory protein
VAVDRVSKSSGTVKPSGSAGLVSNVSSAAPLAPMRESAANMLPPPIPHNLVHRQRLIDMLDAGIRQPVTLICAGAGWGKTALVASWLESAPIPGPVGWVTLDGVDNDPGIFWSHVMAALRTTGVIPEDDGAPGPASADSAPANAFLEHLARSTARLPGPFVLVLDDLQKVEDAQVVADLSALLRHPPEQLHVVLITRTEPALSLHRFLAAGNLIGIRARDLAFSADEAAELLADHHLTPTANDILTLLERTEGWPAGLQLAAAFLTMPGEGHSVDQFAGDVRPVSDYLTWEVLANQPSEVRRFLLWTSTVDQVCGELADAITEGTQSQRILEQLEQTNAFVVGLGSHPRWFRYHHLLRDLLNHQLRIGEPALLEGLHIRAAHWYANQDATREALLHATAGHDWPFVGRMLAARAGPLILTRDRTLIEVLERVPAEQFSVTAELTLCAALVLFHAGDYDASLNRISQARALLPGRERAERRSIEISLRTVEAALARLFGDMPALVAATTDVLGWLPEVPLAQLPSALQYRAIALGSKGVGLLWSGQPHHADRYLWAALTAARAARVELVEIDALGHLALFEFMRGGLQEAYDHATSSRDLAERRGLGSASQVVPAYLALALVELERNNLTETDRALHRALDAHRASPEAAQSVVLGLIRTRLLMARGELDTAGDVLRQTRAEAYTLTATPVLDRWVRLAMSEVDLASGRPDQVKMRYAQLPAGDRLTPRESVCLARADLALNDLRHAEEVLKPLRTKFSDVVSAVEAWIVTALVAEAQRQGNRSANALACALALAEQQYVRRPFLNITERQMPALVERQRWLIKDGAGFLADILAEMNPQERSPETSPLVDDLSEREVEVLRYLPTVLNASEIAGELHVSINTVKAHLRSIYRKLGASRRREAVVRARALRLL